jgi:hypothetical protein
MSEANRYPSGAYACYLESSKDSNIPIYQSFGFKGNGRDQGPWKRPNALSHGHDVQA